MTSLVPSSNPAAQANTPHRISHRHPARLLRPLKGGVISLQSGNVVYKLDREHGLHRAQESGNTSHASLNYHSPLEESVRQGLRPQSNRWGGTELARSPDRRLRPQSNRRGQTRRPSSEHQSIWSVGRLNVPQIKNLQSLMPLSTLLRLQ